MLRLQFGKGIYFRGVRDPRFKTVRVAIHFLAPLCAQWAAKNALVPGLLLRASREYPDYTQLGCHLADLYGASINADVERFGALQVLSVSGTCLADRYALEGERLCEDLASLLCSMAFSPLLSQQGGFEEEGFAIEKRQLLETIDSEYGDKRALARKSCIRLLLSPEYSCTSRFGEREEIEAVTSLDCAEAWQRLCRSARIEISAIGNCEPETLAEIFRASLERIPREEAALDFVLLPKKDQPASLEERQELMQAKLVLGCRTGTNLFSPENDALRLACVMLGGSPNSKLFTNVREEKSLCYYCGASFDSASGTVMIDSGVAPEKVQDAREAILAELAAMQRGDFTDEEIDNAKRYLRDSYRTIFDYAGAIDSWYLFRCFLSQIPTPEETAERIGALGREQIIDAAKRFSLAAEYLLTGGEGDAR